MHTYDPIERYSPTALLRAGEQDKSKERDRTRARGAQAPGILNPGGSRGWLILEKMGS